MSSDELERRLGRSVRSVRVETGLRQVDLTELANVSLGALKHLESGAGSTTTTLVKVLRALGRDGWLDELAPASTPFNPLGLLETREAERRTHKGPTTGWYAFAYA